jgi:hypothetical protein
MWASDIRCKGQGPNRVKTTYDEILCRCLEKARKEVSGFEILIEKMSEPLCEMERLLEKYRRLGLIKNVRRSKG